MAPMSAPPPDQTVIHAIPADRGVMDALLQRARTCQRHAARPTADQGHAVRCRRLRHEALSGAKS